ncbi:MAG: hypothetical protein F6K19_36345 [Cyanothece sp. SIO1E1]|nr:hypothetical protein [Cyanothece sp. SIO1E1]
MLTVSLSLFVLAVLSSKAWAELARIDSVEGRVMLKREEWDSFQEVDSGTTLYGSDLLKPDRGSRVILICPDRRSAGPVPAGTITNVNDHRLCPGTPRRLRPQFAIGDLRGGSNPSIPYMITPRTGSVLNPTPTLRWNPVAGTEHYTVTLQARGETVWQIETNHTEIPYPEGESELMPRTLYTLIVTADTGATSTEEELALRFNLLADIQADEANAEIDDVKALELPEELKTLILVEEVYLNYGLTAEAIADLESLTEEGIETAQIYRLLGDLYLKSGLRLLAEEHYVRATGLATIAGNLEEEVWAHLGLGTLYSRIDDTERAVRQLRCAQNGAAELGDENLASSIEAELAKLQEPIHDTELAE